MQQSGRFDLKSLLLLSSKKCLNVFRLSARQFFCPVVFIYPTDKCNFKCIMCGDGWRGNHLLNPSAIEKILDASSKIKFVKPRIHFSGHGEPLVYRRIGEVFEMCHDKRLRWSLTTNGFLLKEYAEMIVKNRCSHINISIHGTQENHDHVTGIKNAYPKAIVGILEIEKIKRKYHFQKPLMAINCVVNNYNIDTIKNDLSQFSNLPVNTITLQHLGYFDDGEFDGDGNYAIKDSQKVKKIIELVDYVKSNRFPVKIHFFPKIKKNDIVNYYTNTRWPSSKIRCVFPWLAVRIYPDGSVGMCDEKFGNIEDAEFAKFMNNGAAMGFRKKLQKKSFAGKACIRCCHRIYY